MLNLYALYVVLKLQKQTFVKIDRRFDYINITCCMQYILYWRNGTPKSRIGGNHLSPAL